MVPQDYHHTTVFLKHILHTNPAATGLKLAYGRNQHSHHDPRNTWCLLEPQAHAVACGIALKSIYFYNVHFLRNIFKWLLIWTITPKVKTRKVFYISRKFQLAWCNDINESTTSTVWVVQQISGWSCQKGEPE